MSGINNVTGANINQTQGVQPTSSANQNNHAAEAAKTETNTVEVAADTYAGSVENIKTGNYTKNFQVDREKIAEMKADLKNNVGAFKAMVEGASNSNGVYDLDKKGGMAKWVNDVISGQYKVSQSEQEEAKAAIGEDGYWGVEKTSERIVDFAKALSGGDIEQYDKLLKAIEKGFGAAKEEWGGNMPDITKKTYDAVMEKMQAWKDEATGTKTQTQDAVKASQGVSNS